MGAQRYPLPAEIDVPEFDAEHRDLYRHLTELLHALATGAGGDRLSEILQNLVEHLHDHLAHEERALRLARYPSLEWHIRQHDVGRRRIRSAVRRFKSGDRQVLIDLALFLGRWLPDHIAVTDRMAAAYLRNFERAKFRAPVGYRPPKSSPTATRRS
jgi:hemerythrin-like metal-binding protein